MTPACTEALIRAALDAKNAAYAPYSHFSVGAAVLTMDGRIFKGCNVENASYGAALCAERSALAAAVAAGCRTFSAIAVAGSSETFTMPCGICRQVLAEFHMPFVIAVKNEKEYKVFSGEDLLPHAFSLP